MSLTVTVVDEQTGETATQRVADGDYLLIVTAPAWLSGIQTYRHGATHVLTIKGRRGAPAVGDGTTPPERGAGEIADATQPQIRRGAAA